MSRHTSIDTTPLQKQLDDLDPQETMRLDNNVSVGWSVGNAMGLTPALLPPIGWCGFLASNGGAGEFATFEFFCNAKGGAWIESLNVTPDNAGDGWRFNLYPQSDALLLPVSEVNALDVGIGNVASHVRAGSASSTNNIGSRINVQEPANDLGGFYVRPGMTFAMQLTDGNAFGYLTTLRWREFQA